MSPIPLKLVTDAVSAALDGGGSMSYAELASTTGYSERQIRRALKQLRRRGVSIESGGRPKRFSIPEPQRKHACRLVELNDDEILALKLAAQIARNTLTSTPLGRPLEEGLHRLLESLGSASISFDSEAQSHHWHFGDAPSRALNGEVFDLIRRAAENCQSLLIDYYSAGSETSHTGRKIDPYCITMRGGSWLVIAWCHLRSAIREFSMNDVVNARLCDPFTDPNPYFSRRDNFDADLYYRDRFRSLGGDGVHEVRLLVEKHQSRYFQRKIYHPTQQIREFDDGHVEVSYEVEGLDDVRSFVQSWGTGVTVLEPHELREILSVQATEIARRYGGGDSADS